MLKERRLAADLVASDFLKVEAATDHAALLAASCMATMLDQRTKAKLPVGTGLEALRLISDAATDLVRARQRLVEAHAALSQTRDDIGLAAFAYGDQSECPEVRYVNAAAPKLAAVA